MFTVWHRENGAVSRRRENISILEHGACPQGTLSGSRRGEQSVCGITLRARVDRLLSLHTRILELFDGMGPPAGRGQCIALHLFLSVLDPRNSAVQAGDRGLEKLWSPSSRSQNHPSAREEEMAHNHGNEYQIKIVHEDGTHGRYKNATGGSPPTATHLSFTTAPEQAWRRKPRCRSQIFLHPSPSGRSTASGRG